VCYRSQGLSAKTLEKELSRKIGYEEMVQYKLELCEALAPYSSAVLLDPIYGAAQSIAGGMLPGSKGLLVSIEESGYNKILKAGSRRYWKGGACPRSRGWVAQP